MNKKELEVITPADPYIEKALKEYPKESLKEFYDDETILIDEKLYKAFKHKSIPLWIRRNYKEEARRDRESLEEAIELMREKCKKEKINTEKEFNEKIAIHYLLRTILEKYFRKLEDCENEKEKEEKVDFLVKMLENR